MPYPLRGTSGLTASPFHQRQRGVFLRKFSRGQASIEYLVILAFSVIILLKPFPTSEIDSTATGTQAPVLKQLATAIKDYHKDYTYAMSIASIPDCDYQFAFDQSTDSAFIQALTHGVTVGFDRCVDWHNPAIPALSMDTSSLALTITTNVTTYIQGLLADMIRDSIAKFTDPTALLGEMLTSFF